MQPEDRIHEPAGGRAASVRHRPVPRHLRKEADAHPHVARDLERLDLEAHAGAIADAVAVGRAGDDADARDGHRDAGAVVALAMLEAREEVGERPHHGLVVLLFRSLRVALCRRLGFFGLRRRGGSLLELLHPRERPGELRVALAGLLLEASQPGGEILLRGRRGHLLGLSEGGARDREQREEQRPRDASADHVLSFA